MTWTCQNITTLKTLWTRGEPASAIAPALGSAVTGKPIACNYRHGPSPIAAILKTTKIKALTRPRTHACTLTPLRRANCSGRSLTASDRPSNNKDLNGHAKCTALPLARGRCPLLRLILLRTSR